MDSNYDNWNTVKKKIANSNHIPPMFKEKEIWWTCIGFNIGNEIYGKGKEFTRPVLVVKKFNRFTFLGAPLTSNIKTNPYSIPITINGKIFSVKISQIRTFSYQRVQSLLAKLDDNDYENVIIAINRLFK